MKTTLLLLLILMYPLLLLAQPGTLDPLFNTSGYVLEDLEGYESASAVIVQPDGKILVAGGAGSEVLVARYLPDGSSDASFDADGSVLHAIDAYAEAYAIALQPDGKMLLTGYADSGFFIARLNENGSLDISFDGDGYLLTDLGADCAESTSIAIQSDGKILVGGYLCGIDNDLFFAARFLSDGGTDTGFGNGGVVSATFETDADAVLTDLTLQPDGKILVAGYAEGDASNFGAARLLSDGSFDSTFGTNGLVATGYDPDADASAYALALQPDGKLVLAGYVEDHFGLLRLNSDGSADNGFGTNGWALTPIGPNYSEAYSVVVQSDGKILAGGVTAPDFDYSNVALVRYDSDGSLDVSFGTDGVSTTDLSGAGFPGSECDAMSLQADGKLLVAGNAYETDYQTDLFLARYTTGLELAIKLPEFPVVDLMLFPNPTTEQVTLSFDLETSFQFSGRLITTNGQTVTNLFTSREFTAGAHTLSMELPDGLAAGSYWICLKSSSKQAITLPLVVR